jgi:hypothetical protein
MIKDENGYIIIKNVRSKFGVDNPYQRENLKQLVHNIDTSIEFLDVENIIRSNKSRIRLKLKCSCGRVFYKDLSHVQCDTYLCCYECSRKKQVWNNRKKRKKKYLRKLKSRGFELINKDEWLFANTYCEVVELSTGYRGFVYPNNHKGMLIFSLLINEKNYIYNMNVYAKNHGISTVALKFCNDNHDVLCRCACGKEYIKPFDPHGWGNGYNACPDCTRKLSLNEEKVASWLDSQGIKYKRQYQFNSCRDILPLPFDFHFDKNDGLCEIQGMQHYEPVNWDNDWDKATLRFQYTRKHDKIKRDFCKEKGISFLEISYRDVRNGKFKEQILSFINSESPNE